MSDLLKKIDARTKLAGTNKLEILLFSLGDDQRTGRKEVFGINVFKVREVMRTPEITTAPEMPASVEGMVSLRGALVPVIDLGKYTGIVTPKRPEIMIITEYNGHTQGFLVETVDTILRLDWAAMRVPPDMITNRMAGLVTAVTELENGTLVMMMDVEKVLAETCLSDETQNYISIEPVKEDRHIFFADDSAVARKQIERTLEAMHIRYSSEMNGMRGWETLQKMAQQAEAAGHKLSDVLHLILTDVEMPEMDGYMLTKMIKDDARFAGIPVLMHSSLSGMANKKLGESVGVDAYVSKDEPQKLASKLREMLLLN
ncbi:chemotaxis protein [Chromobacterium violaceum]|uniref:Chemotaxis protein CheV n=1 Tax=Chromobacterium violaceum TaxID=536 RepID=A0AAX2M6S0_CHRVL|nr:chemotaxis protein [Chromobacterium violaceum]OLZ82581.1 fused signal transduction protein/response regulator [Chromobacterium violaceum]OQS48019.1 fused signal transduction protein/response regulator [Chromobacterium violaceum]OQS50814.1 fused signal transduction protein/response regulator [Chromobacterium violaceum]QRO33381.1 chemotaxis protein CheV [Chromobacterium violaceum]QRQ16815.1 chemotaxis protein CheV [Chromobacterium violaceum]